MKKLKIHGAREHNLKNISIELPRDKFIVITGLSGSGKSTLAFNTIYAEGQRRYVESLSAYARQFLGLMNKPDVESIEGLSPAISIEQKTTSHNPRSTVGTVTEIYDYLRLLFAKAGTPYCPKHNLKIQSQSPQKIAEDITQTFTEEIIILAPIIRQKKGTYEKHVEELNREGYTRARIDGKIIRTDEKIDLEKYEKHDIDIVIAKTRPEDSEKINEATENALEKAKGLLKVLDKQGNEHLYSSNMACPVCGLVFEELQPRMFSFNSPFGACPECHGLGFKMEFDEDLIIPDKSLSIADGAIKIYRNAIDGWRGKILGSVAKNFGFDIFTPINKLTKKQYQILMHGSDEQIPLYMSNGEWEGLVPQSERLYQQTESEYRKKELEKFMRTFTCSVCEGKRLKEKVLAVKVGGKSIIDVTDLSVKDALQFFNELKLDSEKMKIAKQLLKEIKLRLDFLNEVGLNYLTLSRAAKTLSGGEAQRIRLATQIGSNLTGVMYILDEPSIGLHQRDNQKLIETMYRLRDIGNTLIVIEHDEDTIRQADHVVDIGPGAGVHGGYVTAQGTPEEIEKHPDSVTGMYLRGEKQIEVPKTRRKQKSFFKVTGASENNLKNLNVKIPTGVLTLVTGVSGSGKSTLVYDIIYKGLSKKLASSKLLPGKHKDIENYQGVDKVIVIDQSPIGRTPRSNPATYTKVFDEIRKIFAMTNDAKIKGFGPGRFSFNVKGGRCENCQGEGQIKIEMNFLPDVYIDCEECKGQRYNKETLQIKYKGKSIAEVLDMTVEEAYKFFENVPSIKNKINTLFRVGLGYIKLGQSSITLSGGEAQRIKLTRELAKRATGKTLYLLDEPTTGLHFHDIKKLIKVLNNLVDKGNSVLIIEHNLDIIKSADYVIDLGPEGGDMGGKVLATGTPEKISKSSKSYTGKYLKKYLKNV